LTYITTAGFATMLNDAGFSSRGVCVVILIRFAISIFALALLGLALSLSAAQSKQDHAADVATVTIL